MTRTPPVSTVGATEAAGRVSYVVAEQSRKSGQKTIHAGYFLTIAEADAYRGEQPDAAQLAVTVLHDRYPIRDLTAAKLESGKIDPGQDEGWRDLIDRIYSGAPN